MSNGIKELNKLEKNSQLLVETPSAKAAPTRLDRCADKSKDLSMCDKALSTATAEIILNSNAQSQTHKSNSAKMPQGKQKSNINEISM